MNPLDSEMESSDEFITYDSSVEFIELEDIPPGLDIQVTVINSSGLPILERIKIKKTDFMFGFLARVNTP